MTSFYRPLYLLVFLSINSCSGGNSQKIHLADDSGMIAEDGPAFSNESSLRAIHVFVALCDNRYQGIVPVPASIGNGQDPKTNLYWGCSNGIKSYFKRSDEWKLISSKQNPSTTILERLLFKHKTKHLYLLADAYDGQFIKQTTIDFLNASSGKNEIEIKDGNKKIYFGGASELLAYIGHDGLMDFSLQQNFESAGNKKRETIILACYSKNYFSPHLKPTGATPLLWTSGLMCPEAYTLHDAIHEWINNNSASMIRAAAARAYSKYQKCSMKAAQNLLVQGW
jgi:hypothetical protein